MQLELMFCDICMVMLAWNCQSFHDSAVTDSDGYTVVASCLYREQLGIKVISQYLQYVVSGESEILYDSWESPELLIGAWR